MPLTEEINENFTLEWSHDGQIVIFHVTSIHRAMVDTWADKYIELLTDWESEGPFLTLHDFLYADSIIMTPHMRRRSQEFVNLRPDVATRTAIVMPKSLFSNATRIFIQSLPQPNPNRIRKIFFSTEEALTWLEEDLET